LAISDVCGCSSCASLMSIVCGSSGKNIWVDLLTRQRNLQKSPFVAEKPIGNRPAVEGLRFCSRREYVLHAKRKGAEMLSCSPPGDL
jgi:hypothetical protein